MTDSSDVSSAAKEMAARFAGSEGLPLLRDLIRRQALTEGKLDVIDQIVAVAKIESYEPGEVIIRQGGTDTDIFFILSGSVRIDINGRDDAERPAGTHIGEMAAIDPAAQRSTTIHASAPTVVARVNEPDFSRVADAHPFICDTSQENWPTACARGSQRCQSASRSRVCSLLLRAKG